MSRAALLVRIDPNRAGVRTNLRLVTTLHEATELGLKASKLAVELMRVGGVVAIEDGDPSLLVAGGFSIVIEYGK